METQQEPVAPRKPVSPYIIGAGLILLLAIATFVAGKYLNGNSGTVIDEGGMESSLELAEELPQTEPQTRGVFQERNDNSIIVAPASMIAIRAPEPGQNEEPVMEVEYTGDKVEVVISSDTLIYRDTTTFDMEDPPEIVQQTVELVTIDDMPPQSAVMVWGREVGDRVIADVIMFSSPFAAHKGEP